MRVEFEWDENKAQININKHGISFEEAKTVFDDPFGLIFDDLAHSFGEKKRDYYWLFKSKSLTFSLFYRKKK
jgi:uncharacterized DUF497 family protein